MAVALAGLFGCAAQRAYDDGQSLIAQGQGPAGMARLEEAVARDPGNVQYRITLASERTRLTQEAVTQGRRALQAGDLDLAEAQFGAAMRLDPRHAAARQGAEDVRKERMRQSSLDDAERLMQRGGAVAWMQAGTLLREVLSVQPAHARALGLKDKLEQMQSQQAPVETRLLPAFRQPITLEFKDAPLKSVFDLVAKLSGLNFYFDKEVKTDLRTTILAKNAAMEDAVRLVLSSHQLELKVLNGNSVLVYPATPTKLKEYQTLVTRAFYVVNADVKQVVNSIKTIVKTKDLIFDERVGLVIIRDTPQAVRMAERIVALQDMTDPEVMLEVEVMEVKRSRLLELGVQWPSQLTLSPLQSSGTPLTLSALQDIGSSTTQASLGNLLINARKEDQKSNILANPRIRVRNKDKAKILIGDKVPVITSTSTATGFASESVSYIDVGLKLDVEPNIYLDDEVAIKVNLEVSNLVREVTTKSGALTYQIGTRGATTVLRLKDGETQILAGLISDEDRATANRVPGLGELPVLGRLFGSQKDDTSRNEILLSITPRVVRSLHRPDLDVMEFESGTEANVGAETLRLTPVGATTASLAPVAPAAAGPMGPLTAPSSDAAPVAIDDGMVQFAWRGAQQAKLGEPYALSLMVDATMAVQSAPVLIEFDASVWAVDGVQEGGFFKRGGGSAFSSEVNAQRGRILVKAARAEGAGLAPAGRGELLSLSLRPLKAVPEGTTIQVITAAPQPTSVRPVLVPVEHWVKVVP
jgi:general secretion pathway protein D